MSTQIIPPCIFPLFHAPFVHKSLFFMFDDLSVNVWNLSLRLLPYYIICVCWGFRLKVMFYCKESSEFREFTLPPQLHILSCMAWSFPLVFDWAWGILTGLVLFIFLSLGLGKGEFQMFLFYHLNLEVCMSPLNKF